MEEAQAPPTVEEANNYQLSLNKVNENFLIIDSGEYDFLFYKWPDAKHMFNSKGDRKYSKFIKFSKKFKTKPNVIVSLKGIDSSNEKYVRINLFARNISNDGFNLECMAWDDSKNYGVYASWIALGY